MTAQEELLIARGNLSAYEHALAALITCPPLYIVQTEKCAVMGALVESIEQAKEIVRRKETALSNLTK